MALKKNNPKQGEVWLFDPDPVKGTEIGKKIRPALILSCNLMNDGPSGLVIIVPITSKNRGIATHIQIKPPDGGLSVESYIMCEQIRAISKERLVKKLGRVHNSYSVHDAFEWITDLLRVEI